MSDTANRRQQQDAEKEAERIRKLLRKHGGHDYDPGREEDDYQGGFTVAVGKNGDPHHVGGFHIDPFRVWPPKMRQHAETLTAHGYRVEVIDYYDGQILEVTPPAPRPRAAWLRALFRGRSAQRADR